MQQLGFGSFYYFLIPVILLQDLKRFNGYLDRQNFFYVVFFTLSFLLLFFNLLIGWNWSKVIMYFSILWVPILLFVKSNSSGINTNEFIHLHLRIGIVVALAGIVEFHVSRDLFGLIPRVGFDVLYEDYSFFYRTRSFLYSIQINALFLVTVFMLLCEHKFTKHKYVKFLLFAIVLYAMILTGSRTAVLLPLLYVIMKYPKKFLILGLPAVLFLGAVGLTYFDISDNEQINRLLDFALASEDFVSQNAGRLETQQGVLENANLFIGNGLGSTYSGSINYINPESYFVQIFSELGILGLMALILSFIASIFRPGSRFKIIIIVLLISGLIVHGLSSPFLFIFWVLIFSKEEVKASDNEITFN